MQIYSADFIERAYTADCCFITFVLPGNGRRLGTAAWAADIIWIFVVNLSGL